MVIRFDLFDEEAWDILKRNFDGVNLTYSRTTFPRTIALGTTIRMYDDVL